MARKSPNDAAKEKAAKQKKTAIVLGVVLAAAVAYAAHTMMGMGGSPSSAPQAADPSATTPAASTPAPTATTGSALPAAPSLGSVAPATTTPSATTSPLVSAVQAPAGAGQLQSFSLFESKDPFHSSGPGAGAAPSSPSGGTSSGGTSGGTSSGGGSAPKIPPAPPAPPPTSAVISVNGSSESVASGSNFPAASPVFQLLSLTATTAKISVVGGSYASGAGTLTLKVNKPVTLVNTADGTRYTLLLMPQGTQASASGPAAAAPGTPTTTTPVTGG
jgi:hypothetical protein